MRIVTIPWAERVEYSSVRIPVETPFGVVEGSAFHIRWGGKCYQTCRGGFACTSGPVLAVDMSTAEIVWLECERLPKEAPA